MTHTNSRWSTLRAQLLTQLQGKRDSLFFLFATTVAYGFDYLFNVVSGRMLGPTGFGTIVALAALGQLFVLGSRVIQTVTVRYVSTLHGENNQAKLAAFFTIALRRAIIGGAIVTALLLLLVKPIAAFFRIEDVWPVAALLFSVWLMAFRPIIGGTLQGEQRFTQLGIVQIVQAVMRFMIGIGLVTLGWGAFGAMAALPIASFIAFLYGLYALRELRAYKISKQSSLELGDFFRYSSFATIGLIGFALLINMDALLVKRFFSAETAGLYASAITLGKVVQFFPVAIIMVLFPKASRRQATNRDPAAVLPPAFGLITLVCVGVSILYFAFPTLLITKLFGAQYTLNGPVLGLIGLAMWLLSLLNVWLNYFLSLDQTSYVFLIWIGVILQAAAFFKWHDHLWQLPTAMAINGLWLTLAGGLFFIHQRRKESI